MLNLTGTDAHPVVDWRHHRSIGFRESRWRATFFSSTCGAYSVRQRQRNDSPRESERRRKDRAEKTASLAGREKREWQWFP